jgi:hypothetical protein
MNVEEKVRENFYRRQAKRLGLELYKRAEGWTVIDRLTRGVTLAHSLSLAQVQQYLAKYQEAKQ